MESGQEAARGRPADTEIDARITRATLRILGKRGYQGLTISGVATAADVPRSTVYRRGRSKAELAVDALRRVIPPVLEFDSGDPLADLASSAADFIVRFAAEPASAVAFEMHAAALADPELAEPVLAYLRPRGAVIDAMARRALATGRVDPALDSGMVRDLVFGPLIYRWLVAKAPVDSERAGTMAAAAIRGLMSGAE